MPVRIEKTYEQLAADHEEALHILHNMRFWQKYWHENFGSKSRGRKEHWEQKADAFLDANGLTEHNNTKAIQIIKLA